MKTTKTLLTALFLSALLALVPLAAPTVSDSFDAAEETNTDFGQPELILPGADTEESEENEANTDDAANQPTADLMATSGTCGDNLTWTLDDEGTLTISGSGDMTNWIWDSNAPWYSSRSSIKKVVIGDGVTSIGSYAFSWCTSLTSVEIGDSVTSIGVSAFYECISLTSVDIGDSVTSIGVSAFYECISLTSVEIGASVESIGNYAFYYCTSLTSIEIPDSVTSIEGHAFADCTSLTSVEIGASVESIGNYVFSFCSSLTSIEIPDSVTSIGEYAFIGTAYYENGNNWKDGVLYISNCLIGADNLISTHYAVKENTTLIADYAFYWCRSLTSIEIPDSVTSIGNYAFEYCTSLTSVDIPDSVTSIGNYAFEYCSKLTSVEIGASVESIGDRAFYNCDLLTSITVDENNEYYSSDERGVLFNKDKTTLIQYPIGNTATTYDIPDSVTSIGNHAFYWCTSLTSVEIGNSVTSIGRSAFYNTAYYNDEENWVDGVLYISNCLIEADDSISGQYTIKEGTILIADNAFSWCTSLTSIEIPDSVTSIGEGAFYWCRSLTSIEIPDSVTSIGEGAFYWCRSLTSIEIPDSVTSIGDYAFYNCPNLTIYGYTGSYAETYANENKIPFVALAESIPGDINGDDKFDYYDVARLYAFYRGKAALDDSVDTDINRDGKFDYYDVARLYAIYRGKAEFPQN